MSNERSHIVIVAVVAIVAIFVLTSPSSSSKKTGEVTINPSFQTATTDLAGEASKSARVQQRPTSDITIADIFTGDSTKTPRDMIVWELLDPQPMTQDEIDLKNSIYKMHKGDVS